MRLAVLVLLAFSIPLAAETENELVGLWGTQTIFGPQIRGELVLVRHGARWTLRAGGFEVSAAATGDDVRITLPGGAGELRGHLTNAPEQRLFWIQPRGNLDPYATPVTLRRVGHDAWRGRLAPLEDRLSLYLLIRREDAGLRGSFSNPEMNWNGRGWFRVVAHDRSIELIDPKTGKTRFVQPYDPRQRQIAMDFGSPIALTPLQPGAAVGFVPRSPAAAPYVYRPPVPAQDGWTVAPAHEAGVDEDSLRALVARILATDPADPGKPRIHSLLVARHGKLILEEYFYGFDADRTHDLRSASKTFTSLMAGIAIDRFKLTLDTPVDAPSGSRITLAHLLTHSSGLACDDNDDASPGNEDVMQSQDKQPDWYRYFLDLPAIHPPGTVYAYCSAGVNMAAGMVARASGMWLPEFFDRYVAQALQMGTYHINLMPDGQAYGGGGIYMRPRDFLKLGQTYLDGGRWNGRRIVSGAWARTSTAHQIRTADGGSDGYGWHRYTLHAAGRDFPEYEASGNGGQFVFVIPALDLTVAVTAGNYGQYQVWRTIREELVPRYILAAAAGSKP